MSLEPTQTTSDGRPVASYAPADAVGASDAPASAVNGLGEDLLDASTFVPPQAAGWRLTIEFCDRCRWQHRATWTATELMITFPAPAKPTDPVGLSALTLVPCNAVETAGRWRIWLYAPGSDQAKLVYDRKVRGQRPRS